MDDNKSCRKINPSVSERRASFGMNCPIMCRQYKREAW